MKPDMLVVLGSVVASLVAVPLVLLYVLQVHGVSSVGSLGFLGIGLFAMTPGLLMGATGLWVAARG